MFASAQTSRPATAGRWHVVTDFPGGSAKIVSVDPARRIIRVSPGGDPERGFVCWWYFKLENLEVGTTITIEISASGWGRPDRAQFSYDNRTWTQTAPGEQVERNVTAYHIDVSKSEMWIAWGPPFVLRDAEELIARICRLVPEATRFDLARSREGRIVPGLRISQAHAAERPRFGVWIQARQHAWESGSSWVARGFIEWLASDDPLAGSLRSHADIYFIPIMDVDNVEIGAGGKNQKPHDHYWDWAQSPYFPEVAAAIDRIKRLEEVRTLDLFIDLHNPGSTDRNILFYTPAKPLLVAERLENQNRFLKLATEEMSGPMQFNGTLGPQGETYDPEKDPASECWIANYCRPQVVALTLETPWNTVDSTQSGYLRIGQQLGRAAERYLQQIERRNAQR